MSTDSRPNNASFIRAINSLLHGEGAPLDDNEGSGITKMFPTYSPTTIIRGPASYRNSTWKDPSCSNEHILVEAVILEIDARIRGIRIYGQFYSFLDE